MNNVVEGKVPVGKLENTNVGYITDNNEHRYLDMLRRTLTASVYPESAWLILSGEDRSGVLGALKSAIINAFARRSLLILKKIQYDPSLRENGLDWPLFGYTMVGMRRLENIEYCIRSVIADEIGGDFVECGVWRGGASIYARGVLNVLGAVDRKVWLADSFEGMPVQAESDRVDPDLASNKTLAVSEGEVRENFSRFNMLDSRVQFIKGWFCDTLARSPIERIAVLRLDGDYYSSTMDALDALYERVAKGGYVIIDDYGDFESCRKAVHDFLEKKNLAPDIKPIDSNGVYWKKN